ncbi:MAG TPA: Bax inhibitor-1/YccA family protein [Candidatus Nanoarchaeia archaeon]|nr:Bax inhibitor-1/YccA family protein [Candidatus Nanoarchaeia archaeon]
MQGETLNSFFQKVYLWMFAGLLISAVASYLILLSPEIFNYIILTPIFWVLIIGELGIVILLSMLLKKISATTAKVLFILYSFLTGLTLSVVFLAYTLESIFMVFFIVAIMFLLLSLYGYFTKRDLSALGPILFIGLIGIIIAAVVNIFLKSSQFSMIISILGVIIFTGLIIYDTQAIKRFFALEEKNKEALSKLAIFGALKLYLDFINLFLMLLRLLGKRRR